MQNVHECIVFRNMHPIVNSLILREMCELSLMHGAFAWLHFFNVLICHASPFSARSEIFLIFTLVHARVLVKHKKSVLSRLSSCSVFTNGRSSPGYMDLDKGV